MNIEKLYRDYSIPYATEGHKHCRPGWVNTECPFCTGNPGLHLGYNTYEDRFVCWRCGGHRMDNTIASLLKVTPGTAYDILRNYGSIVVTKESKKRVVRIKAFKYPEPFTELQESHKQYLIHRDFNYEQIESTWNVMATGPFAKLDKINYKQRIIIPFVWDGKVVSFDSRDITDKQLNKYQACPEARELIGHKQILYGKQEAWKDVGICVEGPTDVWRFGVYSFATSGIKFTLSQVREMARQFKRVFIVFDGEKQAQRQALKLKAELEFRKVDVHIIDIEGDPGGMKQSEADYLVKQLLK